ncbi:MAG: ABC-type protease/lipase transport system, ATPase and permease component, partial [uncultured bacterium]
MIALTYSSFRFIQYWEHTLNEKISHESHENNFVIDVLSNIHTVKAMGMESLMIRRYERLQKTGAEVNYFSGVEAGDLITLKMLASQLVVILIVIFGGIYVIKGKMAIGGLAACTLLVSRITQPMTRAL